MKARVSYTMEIKEVPDLIKRLLSECKGDLDTQGRNLEVNLHDVKEAVSKIVTARQALSVVDSKLEDIINLIVGWDQALNPSLSDIADELLPKVEEPAQEDER